MEHIISARAQPLNVALTSDEGPTVTAAGLQEVAQSVSHLCASKLEDALRKEFETWRAKLAFRDYRLSRTDVTDGAVRYYVGKFGLCQELTDLDAVAAFARKAGAA